VRRIESGKLGEVLAFIWRFDRVNRPRIEALRVCYGPDVPVRRLTVSREVAEFLVSYSEDVRCRSSK
jgi:hypothetical protein